MKKLIVTFAVAVISAGSAMAQISAGAGYLNSTVTRTVSDNSLDSSSDGFYVGADFSCPIVAGLSVDPGVYYGFLTREGEFLGMMTGTTQSDFLDVFAFAGPRFNIGLSNTTTTQVLGIESRFDHYGEDGDLQRFDFALGVGIGFDLFQMVRVKFGYDWGLLDIDKNDSMKTSCSGWNIGAAFLF